MLAFESLDYDQLWACLTVSFTRRGWHGTVELECVRIDKRRQKVVGRRCVLVTVKFFKQLCTALYCFLEHYALRAFMQVYKDNVMFAERFVSPRDLQHYIENENFAAFVEEHRVKCFYLK